MIYLEKLSIFAAALTLPLIMAQTGCGRAEQQRSGQGGTALQVEVMRVATQPLEEKLVATGSLDAEEQVVIRPEVSGVVEEINFTESQPVEKGEVLIRLRATDIQAQVEQAGARVKLAEADTARQRRLLESRAISDAEFEQVETAGQVAAAELSLARAQLAKMVIRSPFDGVIGLREISVGGYVDTSTEIATFRRVDPLRLELSVPERYQPYLREGIRVEFTVAGAADRFAGSVYAIEPGIDPVTRTVRFRARVPNPGNRLRPGAFVEAHIVLDEIDDAILVPSLTVVPGLGEDTVFVVKEGQAQSRRIQPGFRTREAVLIREGLQPGELVILTNILQLRDGMPVEVLREVEFRPRQNTDTADDSPASVLPNPHAQ